MWPARQELPGSVAWRHARPGRQGASSGPMGSPTNSPPGSPPGSLAPQPLLPLYRGEENRGNDMAGHFRTYVHLGMLLAGVLAGPAMAQDLAVASSAPVTSIDPHYHTLSPNESLHVHLYDRLVGRDAQGKWIPGLAVSWKLEAA